MDTTELKFVAPWQSVRDAQNGADLTRELQLELSPGHLLYGLNLIPIAFSTKADDVLFGLSDGRVASVHLTWRGGPEEPPWPNSRIYVNLQQWAQELMVPENLEYARPGSSPST